MKKRQKSVKNGQNWAKNGQNWEFLSIFGIFSKFNNFSNIFLTDKFDPGNQRLKEPLSFKSKT